MAARKKSRATRVTKHGRRSSVASMIDDCNYVGGCKISKFVCGRRKRGRSKRDPVCVAVVVQKTTWSVQRIPIRATFRVHAPGGYRTLCRQLMKLNASRLANYCETGRGSVAPY